MQVETGEVMVALAATNVRERRDRRGDGVQVC